MRRALSLCLMLVACTSTPGVDPCLESCLGVAEACATSFDCEFICLDLGLADAGPDEEPSRWCEEPRNDFLACAQRAGDRCEVFCDSIYRPVRNCVEDVCATRPDEPRCDRPDPWD